MISDKTQVNWVCRAWPSQLAMMKEPQRLVTELETEGSCIVPIMPQSIDCTQDYQEQLQQFGIIPSMSRKGNCYATRRWRDSGAGSSMSWCITGGMLCGHRLDKEARSTSDFLSRLAAASSARGSFAGGFCSTVGPPTAVGMKLQSIASTIEDQGQLPENSRNLRCDRWLRDDRTGFV